MTNDEFEAFLVQADEALEEKQQRIKSEYGLGNLSRWKLDEATGSLQFFSEQGKMLVNAETLPIGRFHKKDQRWCWGWNDSRFAPPLRQRAAELKNLKRVTGFDLFNKKDAFKIDADMPWELAAVAVWQLDARGCYRASISADEVVFVALMDIVRVS